MSGVCIEHSHIVEQLSEFKQWSNKRDEEQEAAIAGVSQRMDELRSEVKEVKKEVDDIKENLPDIITRKIIAYIDSLILKAVKGVWKWFLRAVVGGAVVILLGILIRSFFGGA